MNKTENKATPNPNDDKKTKFQVINENFKQAKEITDSAVAIHKSLGKPLNSIFGFISKKMNKPTESKGVSNSESFASDQSTQIQTANVYEENRISSDEVTAPQKTELGEQEGQIVTKESKQNDNPLDELEKQFSICKDNPDYDLFAQKMMVANFNVIRTLRSPDKLLGNFSDLILENLLLSYENLHDEKERENFQKNAGLLMHSVVFFLHARIKFLEQGKDDETQNLLECASNDLENAATFFVHLSSAHKLKVGVEGITVAPGVVKASGLTVQSEFDEEKIKNACKCLPKIKSFGFFARLFSLSKKIEAEEKAFGTFLVDLFESFQKYRCVFGSQNRMIAQIVERYGNYIVEKDCFSKDVTSNGLNRLSKQVPDLRKEIPSIPKKPNILRMFIPTLIVETGFIGYADYMIFLSISGSEWATLWGVVTVIASIFVYITLVTGSFALLESRFCDESAMEEYREKEHSCYAEQAKLYYNTLAKTFYDFYDNK